ncbi:MAG: hypothetical protein IKG14_02540 [Clostridia bacterium]|nr:hypothetical protein [Clostridia bacterium]
MATFELIEDGTYRIEGEITQEDVDRINAFPIRTKLVLQNTKKQSSEVIGRINPNIAYFSVLGGLDYYEKSKYNSEQYKQRTELNPLGLSKVLKYFEKIESEMNPEWTDVQKCMYAYNALATDIEYVRDLEQDILTEGVTERGLNGVLYGQLTCAGFALTFKEMMDRIGIKCYYQNQIRVHDFNVVELDGKLRGVDVTFDCTDDKTQQCSFYNFGRDPEFYQKHGHQIARDKQETVFDLATFTDQELRENYDVIRDAINKRERYVSEFRNYDRDRRRRFMPVDSFLEELQEEKEEYLKLRILNKYGMVPKVYGDFIDETVQRFGFLLDYIGTKEGDTNFSNIVDDIKQRANINGWLIMDDEDQFEIVSNEDGKRVDLPINDEQKNRIGLLLNEDVKNYYINFFNNEFPKIDDTIETYYRVCNASQDLAPKMSMLRGYCYSKIRLLAYGKEFFEYLGIPKEDVEVVAQKTQDCLENTVIDFNDSRTPHENDLDFLYAIVQNDIIDKIVENGDYSEENLTELIGLVRENWTDAEFTDEEFRDLRDEAMSRTMISEDISRETVDAGIGIEETNEVIKEISRNHRKDKNEEREI